MMTTDNLYIISYIFFCPSGKAYQFLLKYTIYTVPDVTSKGLTFFTSKELKLKKTLEADMTIGTATRLRIQELCTNRNITLNKLSIMCGITQSTLNNIVSGRNNSATISTIKKICDGLEMDIRVFFDSELFNDLEQEIR